MKIAVLTLFPNMFNGPFGESIVKRAIDKNLINIELINFRTYSKDKHNRVDDQPYGGGSGMVIKPEPVFDAVNAVKEKFSGNAYVVLLSPQGRLFNQEIALELSQKENLIFICGHYEGFDERITDFLIDDEISIGDYILTGGEIPAMVVIDSVVRLVPEVLGNDESCKHESFANGLLEYAQYTRPEEFRGLKVPEVLLSGNHKKVSEWRKQNSIEKTLKKRPDLMERYNKGGRQNECT